MKRAAHVLSVLVIAAVAAGVVIRVTRERRPPVKQADSIGGPISNSVPNTDPTRDCGSSSDGGNRSNTVPPARMTRIAELYDSILKVVRKEGSGDSIDSWEAELQDLLGDDPIGVLSSLLRDNLDEDLAICVLQSLIEIHDAGNKRAALSHLLGSGVRTAKKFGQEMAMSLLSIASGQQERPRLRSEILELVGPRFKYDPATFSLVQRCFLSEVSPQVRASALAFIDSCISEIPAETAITVFSYGRLSLSDPDERVRLAGASLLSRDPSSSEALIAAVASDPSAAVRYAMLESLTAVGQQPAPKTSPETQVQLTKCLISATGDSDPKIAQLAFRTLGRLATNATAGEIYDVLTGAFAKSQSQTLRQIIAESLYNMAVNGQLRERIREDLHRLATDPNLAEALREYCATQARRLQ
jgi:hypothetical protein